MAQQSALPTIQSSPGFTCNCVSAVRSPRATMTSMPTSDSTAPRPFHRPSDSPSTIRASTMVITGDSAMMSPAVVASV